MCLNYEYKIWRWIEKSGLRQHHVKSNYTVCLILACIGNGYRAGSLVLEWNENWTESSLLDLNWEVQLNLELF